MHVETVPLPHQVYQHHPKPVVKAVEPAPAPAPSAVEEKHTENVVPSVIEPEHSIEDEPVVMRINRKPRTAGTGVLHK